MVNYELAKIYKVIDKTNGNIYIGSTCEPTLARRLAGHRGDYKRYLDGKFRFVTSFEILKNGNYEIVLLEECKDITSKDQLHKRERFYIENNVCVNRNIPSRTQKEYYKDNKDNIIEYQKDYYEDNKDKIIEYQKGYYKENKDNIIDYYKKYNEDNKEVISEKKKEYYKDNKDKLKQRMKEYYRNKKNKNKEIKNEPDCL
jgi:hypothetical protein